MPTSSRSQISRSEFQSVFDRLEKLETVLAASDKRAANFEKKFLAEQKKSQRLEAKVRELEADNRRLRQQRSGNEEILLKEIQKMEKEIHSLKEQLEAANKQLAWFRKQKFDKTSEKNAAKSTPPDDKAADTPDDKLKPKKGQKAGAKGHGRSDRSEVDTRVKFIEIPGGCACESCGTQFCLLPKTEASPLTEFESSVVRTVFQRCIYVSQCKCNGKKIVVAPPPPKIVPRSEIGNFPLGKSLRPKVFARCADKSRTERPESVRYAFGRRHCHKRMQAHQ